MIVATSSQSMTRSLNGWRITVNFARLPELAATGWGWRLISRRSWRAEAAKYKGSVVIKRIGRTIAWIIEGCGALVAAAGVVLLYILLLAWLKSGVWPAYDLQMLWDQKHPHVEW